MELTRVPLPDRDPDATQSLEAIDALLARHEGADRVVFALDAPIQARARPELPARRAVPTKGTVKRRACENFLDEHRARIDKADGGSRGWQPRIQPGAPLAPRVIALLSGLESRGFVLWSGAALDAKKLVIECFPAEGIWAMKRLGYFEEGISADRAKLYKRQKGKRLSGEDMEQLVADVLVPFDLCLSDFGYQIVDRVIEWIRSDSTGFKDGGFRGGKLLDDVVDTTICLATSLSYAHHQAHVWYDPRNPDDGHIIGPGYRPDGRWTAVFDSRT
jgi:hypothetical protein